MADAQVKNEPDAGEPEVVSEVLYDENSQITTDPKLARTGNVVVRRPDGTLEYHRIVKSPSA